MNKRLFLLTLAVLLCGAASAQEETPANLKFYGFIRNYMVFDTHEVHLLLRRRRHGRTGAFRKDHKDE